MSTYTQIIYHIVFSTKNRQGTLDIENHESLFRYTWGIIKNKRSTLHQMNGMTDHLHILTEVHPSIALADFVKDIKLASSHWIRDEKLFPSFDGWQEGYGAFTHSHPEKPRLMEYIKGQKEHHRRLSFKEELAGLLEKAGIQYDPKYLI
jgi:REP element-mobilizing transposase RayT